MPKRFYQITPADGIISIDNFVGVRIDGEMRTDLRYTPDQLVSLVGISSKKTITLSTVSEDSKTISDPFFNDKTISEIVTNNQAYIGGYDFTQVDGGGDITGVNIEFFVGQVLIAKA